MNHSTTLRSLCCFVCIGFAFVSTSIEAEATKTDIKDSNKFHSHINYDVFLNFRGSDIRHGFLSHLTQALRLKKIVVFVDDQIHKGDEIQQSLFQAIEESLISLVIFSQNYTYSHWCLDELVKIVQCRHKDRQILIPVFHKLDPATVKHQRGTYANAFAEHEKKYNLTRVQKWRSALSESASISGFPSSMFPHEADLIEHIVKRVWMKLNDIHKHKLHSKRVLIGLGNQISHVESLLLVDSKDVRAIAIWGMPGIGKTTIAENVYNRLRSKYDNCYFQANVREECRRHGILYLKKELYSALFRQQDLKFDTPHGLPYFVERRLRRMKVLVVLDDVNDPQQLENLIGTNLARFGRGSRIIITTRDKQVLAKRVDDNDVYEVKPLEFDDSFRLFNVSAFEQNHPKMDFYEYELSKKMVNYAQGIPLVLKELGHFIGGIKDKRTWESQFEKLTTRATLLKNVHDVIRLSCDDLNRVEKKVLLDIASLSDGLHLKVGNIQLPMNVDNIQLLLEDGGYNLVDVLQSLKNKALLTISQHKDVSMHSIIQLTALEIVREESIEVPKHNKGSQATYGKGMKQLSRSIGLQTKLEKLLLAHSEIENLPEDIKLLTNLRHLNLSHCKKLQSLPVLPSLLKTLDASDCVSLKTVTFLSATLQLQKENKTRVSFWNCLELDEPSLNAIGLNAHINMMNFAFQHVSTFGNHYESQATYVYPGNSVPYWLEYKTTNDYMTIDLSSHYSFDHLGFIFCFIVPEVESQGSSLIFNIATGEGEDDYIQVFLERTSHGIQSDHVYLIYNQVLSRYINSRLKIQPKLEIRVTLESGTLISERVPLVLLKGFGISPINTSQYIHFSEQMELADCQSLMQSSVVKCLLFSVFSGFLVLFHHNIWFY